MREQQPGVERVGRRSRQGHLRRVVDRERDARLTRELTGQIQEAGGRVETEHAPRPAHPSEESRRVAGAAAEVQHEGSADWYRRCDQRAGGGLEHLGDERQAAGGQLVVAERVPA